MKSFSHENEKSSIKTEQNFMEWMIFFSVAKMPTTIHLAWTCTCDVFVGATVMGSIACDIVSW